MSHVAIVGAEFRVFKTVASHSGVLVVDWVDEEEDDGDGNNCDCHKSSYEGKVVLCNEIDQTGNRLMSGFQFLLKMHL